MRKIIKLTESDLEKIVKKVLKEQFALPTVKGGQKGEEVKNLQRALMYKGYDLGNSGPNKDGVDGDFGTITKNALMQFQKKNNIKPTGQLDQLTRNSLFAGGFNPLSSFGVGYGPTTPKKEKNPEKKSPKSKPVKIEGTFLDCVKNSPKKKEVKLSNGSIALFIDGNYFFNNGRVKTSEGKMGNYFCYENGVKIKDSEGEKTYVETGVKTEHSETSRFSGGITGFFRKTFPNVAQIFSTKPLTGEDFTEPQKQVVFNVIQNAINKRGQNRQKGCTEYADYSPDTEKKLTKDGGATTAEMMLGSGFSDEFRVATLLGRFCYTLQPNGSYIVTDDYDFHKWKSFTVKPDEVKGMSYPEKIGYVMTKTGLSPYGAIRHIGYLEHPDNAPAATKTKIVLNIDSGYFAKLDKKKNPMGSPDDTAVA